MAQRRTHRKTRLGCQPCKRRHIKCDEGRPSCNNCTTTERQCVYVLPRPRSVPSTSPTPLKHHGVSPITISPSSSLLHPLSAATTLRSTPSSPSLLQNGSSCSINLRHMVLLTNFIFEVGSSLDTNYAIDSGLLRSILPVILSKPFLLLGALALSALHLNRTRPGQADDHLAEATSLQLEALALFDGQLGSITSDNCEAVLLFANLLSVHSLGEAVTASESDADGFLDRFVAYLCLHRGVRIVTSKAWTMLLQSSLSPVLHRATDQLRLAESQQPEEAVFVVTELGRLLDSSDMSEESNTACRDAVSRLGVIYQAEPWEQHSTGLIWSWPILLTSAYTDLLQKRQPEALIILCYFSVLLHRRRSLWFVDGAGRLLIEAVTKSLGSYWRHWLDWPNQIIRNSSPETFQGNLV